MSAYELIFTSASATLDGAGYGVVAKTRGIPPAIEKHMRSLNRYEFLNAGAATGTEVLSHSMLTDAGNRWHVFSRIGDAGEDFTGRNVFIAHHIALSAEQVRRTTPFHVILGEDLFRLDWNEEPRLLEVRAINLKATNGSVNGSWAHASEGLAGPECWKNFLAGKKTPAFLMSDSAAENLQLICEAGMQLPGHQQQEVTFITALGSDAGEVRYDWIGLVKGTQLARTLVSRSASRVFDATNSSHFTEYALSTETFEEPETDTESATYTVSPKAFSPGDIPYQQDLFKEIRSKKPSLPRPMPMQSYESELPPIPQVNLPGAQSRNWFAWIVIPLLLLGCIVLAAGLAHEKGELVKMSTSLKDKDEELVATRDQLEEARVEAKSANEGLKKEIENKNNSDQRVKELKSRILDAFSISSQQHGGDGGINKEAVLSDIDGFAKNIQEIASPGEGNFKQLVEQPFLKSIRQAIKTLAESEAKTRTKSSEIEAQLIANAAILKQLQPKKIDSKYQNSSSSWSGILKLSESNAAESILVAELDAEFAKSKIELLGASLFELQQKSTDSGGLAVTSRVGDTLVPLIEFQVETNENKVELRARKTLNSAEEHELMSLKSIGCCCLKLTIAPTEKLKEQDVKYVTLCPTLPSLTFKNKRDETYAPVLMDLWKHLNDRIPQEQGISKEQDAKPDKKLALHFDVDTLAVPALNVPNLLKEHSQNVELGVKAVPLFADKNNLVQPGGSNIQIEAHLGTKQFSAHPLELSLAQEATDSKNTTSRQINKNLPIDKLISDYGMISGILIVSYNDGKPIEYPVVEFRSVGQSKD